MMHKQRDGEKRGANDIAGKAKKKVPDTIFRRAVGDWLAIVGDSGALNALLGQAKKYAA